MPGSYGGFVAKIAAGAPPSVWESVPIPGRVPPRRSPCSSPTPFGAADLTTVSVLFNAGTATRERVLRRLYPGRERPGASTDAGAAPGSSITPGSGTQQNSQCTLNGASSERHAGGERPDPESGDRVSAGLCRREDHLSAGGQPLRSDRLANGRLVDGARGRPRAGIGHTVVRQRQQPDLQLSVHRPERAIPQSRRHRSASIPR